MNPQDEIELFEALQAEELKVRVLHNNLSQGGSLYDLSYSNETV